MALQLTNEWDKVFPKSEKVNHRKVSFKNHFGIKLAADLYEPKDTNGRLPAIAVAGPYGAVKEQSSGLYAQEMAERGFVTLAFDPSYTGESGGEPRYVTSWDLNVEDFQAAVDYLCSLENVVRIRFRLLACVVGAEWRCRRRVLIRGLRRRFVRRCMICRGWRGMGILTKAILRRRD